MNLNKETADKIIKKLKEFGYGQKAALVWLYTKKEIDFRTPERLTQKIRDNQFNVKWAESLAKMVGKSCARSADELRGIYR